MRERGAEPVDDVVVVQPRRRSAARLSRCDAAGVAVVGVVVACRCCGRTGPAQPGRVTGRDSSAGAASWSPTWSRADGESMSRCSTPPRGRCAREWTAAVTASSADPAAQGWVYGTDLTLAATGWSSGCRTAPGPAAAGCPEWGGDYAVAPLPLERGVPRAGVVRPVPDGNGSPEVPPGTYDLVVSQTVGLQSEGGRSPAGWGVAVRR